MRFPNTTGSHMSRRHANTDVTQETGVGCCKESLTLGQVPAKWASQTRHLPAGSFSSTEPVSANDATGAPRERTVEGGARKGFREDPSRRQYWPKQDGDGHETEGADWGQGSRQRSLVTRRAEMGETGKVHCHPPRAVTGPRSLERLRRQVLLGFSVSPLSAAAGGHVFVVRGSHVPLETEKGPCGRPWPCSIAAALSERASVLCPSLLTLGRQRLATRELPTRVEQSKVLIKEGGVQLLLTIVDTPGFGDAVDNSNCWQPVTDYIDSKFEDYLNAESRVNRRQMPDSRVQCCLYFIAPSGHGLKPLDIEFMKRLHEKVNIIPLIAKADTLTPEECQQFKKQDRLPLAVVGSNTIIEVNGKRVRGRQYPWGVAEGGLRLQAEAGAHASSNTVVGAARYLPHAPTLPAPVQVPVSNDARRTLKFSVYLFILATPHTPVKFPLEKRNLVASFLLLTVENGEHCDFTILRNMLIRTHMQDLKDVTNNVHYENYRSRKLAAVTYNGVDNNKSKGQLTNLPSAARGRVLRISPERTRVQQEHVHGVAVQDDRRDLGQFRTAVSTCGTVTTFVSDRSPLAQMEEERREHVAKMKKMEMEMEQVFEMKVKEKVQKLKDSEAELQRRHEQMKKNLEAQHKELEEKRRQFEDEKASWEAQQRILEQQNSSRTLEKNKKKGKIF
ncbi:Septin-7 [Tupaia chinensis]|uniref:Septin-7 n=1 Tax=Tupaia chinensis TaxID=246437 RepID=L9L703_TUPCH|nr:Septin-7 [Tupaia chinensis]